MTVKEASSSPAKTTAATLTLEPCNVSDLLEKDNSSFKSKQQKLAEWGFPGHLTKAEGEIFTKFRAEVNKRGGEFRNTVYSFTYEEGEAYTLTRWLRARKYNLSDTITMVEEATQTRAKPRQHDYYPNAELALGVDPALFNAQYPQLYSGFSKSGCPVFYSKPGRLDIDGIECITTLEGILKYHWHVMQQDYKSRLLAFKLENPDFKRFECVSVLDLSHLTVTKLGSRTLDIIKKQASIDSLCFPETMNKMVIVNAPTFFNVTWKMIKGFVDVRTASKIELFSSTKAAEKCLKGLIADDQLPRDYGGTAESTDVTLAKMSVSKIKTEVLYVKSSASSKIALAANEEAEVWIYTRSKAGADFHLINESKTPVGPVTNVKHVGAVDDNTPPTRKNITASGNIQGPMSLLKVKAVGKGSILSANETYLVVFKIHQK